MKNTNAQTWILKQVKAYVVKWWISRPFPIAVLISRTVLIKAGLRSPTPHARAYLSSERQQGLQSTLLSHPGLYIHAEHENHCWSTLPLEVEIPEEPGLTSLSYRREWGPKSVTCPRTRSSTQTFRLPNQWDLYKMALKENLCNLYQQGTKLFLCKYLVSLFFKVI